MAKSKFDIGDLIVDSLKLGDGDIKSFLGDSLLYPLAKSIEDAVVTCASATYNGSNQTAQDITVVLSGVTLVENTDYTVTQNAGGTNVGSYNVTVTGIGDYENTASGTFTINKVTPTVVSPVPNVLTYNGSAQELVTAGSTNFGTLKYKVGSDSWSTSIPTRTRGGSYTVYYKVVGDSNINDIPEDTVACSINEKLVTAVVTVSPSTYTYNGSYCEPTVTAKDGETVIDPSEYTVTYSNNLNAGTATVTIYDVIGGDYYVTGSTTFTINKADQAAPTASVTAATYPGTSTASATGGGGIGTLTWTNGNTRTAAGTADTYAYWSGNDNYNASPNSNKVTLSVAKYTPTVTLAATNRQYNGNALYATASVGTPSGGVATKGTIYYGTSEGATTYNVAYTGGSVNLSSVSVTNVGSVTVYAYFVPDSTCNDVYNNSSNVSKTFSVSKADQSAPTATGATTTYHNTATATASGGGGQGTLTWTNGNTRTATGSQDTYAYWAGNSNYNASPNSNMVTLTVNKATDQSVTVTLTDRTYNTSSQVVASATSHGCTFYLGFGSSSTSAPTSWGSANSSISQTNAGTYYVWYKGTADENHSADISATYKGTVTIGKADQSAPTATGATSTYPTGATATASGGGGQGTLTWTNGSSRSSCGSQTTKAYWGGNSNYNASPYSNEVTIKVNTGSTPSYTAPTAKTGLVYNGSSQTLYNAGSSSNGTFGYSNGTRTAVGSQTVSWSFTPTDSCLNGTSGSFTGSIAQKAISIPTPTGVSRAYNGNAATATFLAATGAGITKYRYSTNGSSWTETTSNPSQTNAGTLYTQAYYSANDSNYSGAGWSSSATLTISKADQSAPTATGATTTYNTTATASGGGGVGSIEWESAQSQSSVGSHTTRARWSGNSNYNASPWSNSVTVQMNKAAGSVTINAVTTTYNGSAQALATVSNNTGTMHYSTNGTSWSTSIPTGTNATGYTVYWYMDASTNYEGIASASSRYVSSTIGKADQSAPTATGATTTYNTTATATASGGGGQGSLEWESAQSQSSVGSHTTRARWGGNSNYNASPWSNSVTVQMNKANISPTVSISSWTCGGTASNPSVAGNTGGGTVTYYYKLSSASSWSTTKPSDAGDYNIRADIAATTNYNSGTCSSTFAINKGESSLSFAVTGLGVETGETKTNAVTVNAGDGTVTYSSNNTAAVTVNNSGVVTGVSVGNATITANISQTSNYNAASATYAVSCGKPIIGKFNITDITYKSAIGSSSQFIAMEIDGVALPSPVNTYQFSRTGEHTIKYILANPTSIGDYAFSQCSDLTSVTIPDIVTSIGRGVFERCYELKSVGPVGSGASVEIPTGVTSIGNSAFRDCTGLTSVTIPNTVTSIGDTAFESGTSITTLTIPNSVTSIGNSAFRNCASLTTLTIPNSVTSIGSYTFRYCTSLTTCTIGNGITTISNGAFQGCGFTSVIIGSGVTKIDTQAFRDCSNLTGITIPNNVTTISSSAFTDCSDMTIFIIGDGLTQLMSYNFKGCKKLANITCNKSKAPTVTSNTFYGIATNGTLYIPTGSSSSYSTWMSSNNYYLGSYGWTRVEQ